MIWGTLLVAPLVGEVMLEDGAVIQVGVKVGVDVGVEVKVGVLVGVNVGELAVGVLVLVGVPNAVQL